jgi:AcrR family transcriptional regulator
MIITIPSRWYSTQMSKRDSILDSAQALVVREGSGGFTLDRIAGEAKVSKGGLLYHFPTKEELVSALVARSIEYFEKDLALYKEFKGDAPGANTKAFVVAALEGEWAKKVGLVSSHGLDLFATMLAVISTSPHLMAPMREAYARWQNDIENDDTDPTLATIVRLAADGLWFTELLGLSTFTPKKRGEIVEGLKSLAVEHSAPVKSPAKKYSRIKRSR